MSTTVSRYTGRLDRQGAIVFYIIKSEQDTTRYFNGRRYEMRTTLDHYVHPLNPHRDFTDRSVMVVLPPRFRLVRYSRTTRMSPC